MSLGQCFDQSAKSILMQRPHRKIKKNSTKKLDLSKITIFAFSEFLFVSTDIVFTVGVG